MWKCFVFLVFAFQGISQDVKQEAFSILDEKCNSCHLVEKPESIFTKENMDENARKINRQVFIFKLMPKGEEVKLSDDERQALKMWIKEVKARQ